MKKIFSFLSFILLLNFSEYCAGTLARCYTFTTSQGPSVIISLMSPSMAKKLRLSLYPSTKVSHIYAAHILELKSYMQHILPALEKEKVCLENIKKSDYPGLQCSEYFIRKFFQRVCQHQLNNEEAYKRIEKLTKQKELLKFSSSQITSLKNKD